MRANTPCMNCEIRRSACHDTCDKYKSWKVERQRIKDELRNEKRAQYREWWCKGRE